MAKSHLTLMPYLCHPLPLTDRQIDRWPGTFWCFVRTVVYCDVCDFDIAIFFLRQHVTTLMPHNT